MPEPNGGIWKSEPIKKEAEKPKEIPKKEPEIKIEPKKK